MLERIESKYLDILRTVFLIVASLALIAAIAALGKAIVDGIAYSTPNERPAATGGKLGEWVSAKRRELGTDIDIVSDEIAVEASEPEDAQITEAAKRIYAYAEKAEDEAGESSSWVIGFNRQYFSIPSDYRQDFLKSIESIARQLSSAKGEQLTARHVDELLIWNKQRFDRSVASSLVAYRLLALANSLGVIVPPCPFINSISSRC